MKPSSFRLISTDTILPHPVPHADPTSHRRHRESQWGTVMASPLSLPMKVCAKRLFQRTEDIRQPSMSVERPVSLLLLTLTVSMLTVDRDSFSQPQPFPTTASRGKGCFWQSTDSRAKGYWLDFCSEVYSQRRRFAVSFPPSQVILSESKPLQS